MQNENIEESTNSVKLPIEYQLGDRIYKTDVYIENYIVKIEIYKPKDKLRKPTLKTINRIFRRIGDLRILSKESQD